MRRGAELRVADVVRQHGTERGDLVAVRHGRRALTYAQLDDRSNRLAQVLIAAGVGAGDRVAHLDKTGVELIELLFAVSKLGAVLVPLNWRLAAPELGAILADSRAPLLVAGAAFGAVAERLVEQTRATRGLLVVDPDASDGYERQLAAHLPEDPGRRGASGDVVIQMYTSGTTGVPKGVLTTHRNLAAAADSSPLWEFDERSVSLTPLPMFHIGGIGWAFLGLWNGASTILVGEFVAADVLDTLERERVTNAVVVPTILHRLTTVPGAGERDYSALRSIAYGGSPITTTVLKAALRTFKCPLFGVYGLTETTGGVVQLDAADHEPDGPREHLLRSAGRPFPWVDMKIVDPVTGDRLAPGRVGEVWLRAPNVSPGYFDRPAETASAHASEGWLRTGDGGYVDDDGYLFLTDRIKDMIVSGGENVYPAEVEEALAQHPAVDEVTVIGIPDERWGEAVKALVIPVAGARPGVEELLTFARERLAGYKLPRSIDFVDEFPRTPSGKVVKQTLRANYAGVPRPVT
jgi:long-chain acyl-CoA synthetase